LVWVCRFACPFWRDGLLLLLTTSFPAYK
jgi:hypothetical protein